jgi:acyl carrier protein
MLPSAFMLLDALPLMPNGKIDRRALLAPESVKHPEEETSAAPTSMVHYQLMQIWEELLDARPIGIRDNFFHIGGHSILAARLVNQIEQVFSKKIPLATLFAGPTIEQLASALQQQEDTDPLVAVQTVGSKLSRYVPFSRRNRTFQEAFTMGALRPMKWLGNCIGKGKRLICWF